MASLGTESQKMKAGNIPHTVDVSQNLATVRKLMNEAEARRRTPGSTALLLAVSKTVPVEAMRAALRSGVRHFGENYVQEALKKREAMIADGAIFHLIGGIQRNKVKKTVGSFALLHSIDEAELASLISHEAEERGICQEILIQVNISEETSKSGVLPERCAELCQHALRCKGLSLRGLMSIGAPIPQTAPETERRREFVQMRELRDTVAAQLGVSLPELSMGMSHDFQLAIEEGATIVRVGSAIFGPRGHV